MNVMSKTPIRGMACVIAMLGLLLPLAANALELKSNSRYSAVQAEKERARESAGQKGPFNGYDPKAKEVWIDDMVYRMHTGLRVVGTPTKLGLLSEIKNGEIVRYSYIPANDGSSIPLLTEIRRR